MGIRLLAGSDTRATRFLLGNTGSFRDIWLNHKCLKMKKKGQHVSITTFKRTHNVSPDVIKRRRLSFVRLQFVTVQGNKFKLHSTNKRFRLAKTCVYLRCLAMTCDRFNGAQFCPQVAVRFSPLDHRTQVVASDQKLFSVLLALVWSRAQDCDEKAILQPPFTGEHDWPTDASLPTGFNF